MGKVWVIAEVTSGVVASILSAGEFLLLYGLVAIVVLWLTLVWFSGTWIIVVASVLREAREVAVWNTCHFDFAN